jgi:hypothetical protein
MQRIRFRILVAVLALSPSLASLAQDGTGSAKSSSIHADDTVRGAPYSAEHRFTSVSDGADGKTASTESAGGSEARDSQGRTYSAGERHWIFQGELKSEMLYRIDDPVANTQTRWDSTTKDVKVIHFPQSASKDNAPSGPCPTACPDLTMSDPGDVVEKLGTKLIEGVLAEGTRSSYTVPIGQDHNSHPIVVVHETWYCPELKIVVLETNDDPRSGQTRNELVSIVRGEPDVAKYLSPADYVVHNIQVDW